MGPNFIGNASNPWAFKAYFPARDLFWVGFVAAIVASLGMIYATSRRQLSSRVIIETMLLSSMIIPFLLPKMHERFFFAADILSFSAAWAWRDRTSVAIAVLVQTSSALAILSYLRRDGFFVQIGALLMAAAIAMAIARFLRCARRPEIQSRAQEALA